MKKIIELKLRFLSKRIIIRYKPEIIGITGSVGKTSTKEAVYAVVSKKSKTRRSIKNYNNEIGLPLTVIGAETQGRNIGGWLSVFAKGLKTAFGAEEAYPEVLVLEMGADKPGDIAYLLDIVDPNISIITRIGNSHLEAFKTPDAIKQEKALIFRGLTAEDWAVMNADDDAVMSLVGSINAKLLTFGIDSKADIMAVECNLSFRDNDGWSGGDPAQIAGLSFKLRYKGSVVPVLMPHAIGYNAVYAALAASAVGIIHGMNLVEISQALRDYESPKGRMRPIKGVKKTLIIDDTYNSSPASSIMALKMLGKIPVGAKSRRIAVLGDMLELGNTSVSGHLEVGRFAAEEKIDLVYAVGERAADIARGAVQAGMSEAKVFHFDDTDSAGNFLEDQMKRGDVILVKGSQGARMERIVKEIMADPLKAGELLVRQDEGWTS